MDSTRHSDKISKMFGYLVTTHLIVQYGVQDMHLYTHSKK